MTVLCWDFDGTLTHSHHLWSNCVHEALMDTLPNCGVTPAQMQACMATGFPWHTPEQDFTPYVGENWWTFMEDHFFKSYLSLGITEVSARTASKKVRSLIKRPGNYTLYPGVKATLAEAQKRGCVNMLLSNNYPDLTEVMDALGLTDYFSRTIISGVVGYDKPRPEIFQIAKALYPGEHRFIMVGDNPIADIAGGRTAGMTTVMVHKGFDPQADYCFENLWDILSVI